MVNFFPDFFDVIHSQRLDVLAAVLMFIDKAQQLSDLRHCKTQVSASADEGQSLQMILFIQAMTADAARRFRQQALSFVITYGFDLAIGPSGQRADSDREKFGVFHRKSLESVASTGNRLKIPQLVSSFFE